MKRIILTSIIAIALITMSCKKDASKFQGAVRYIVDSTQSYMPAIGAMITLHDKDTSQAAVVSGTTDSEGIFMIENVPDGIYVGRAEITVDSITYIGVSEKVECKGKDFIAAPIDCWDN